MLKNCISGVGSLQSGVAMQGRTSSGYSPSKTIIQKVRHWEGKFLNLRNCCVNAGAVKEIAGMLDHRLRDICCGARD